MTSARQQVRLAPLLDDDIEPMFKWINDRDTVVLNAPFAPVHFADHTAWFDVLRQRKDAVIFAIRTVEDGRLVGSCQLHSMHPVHRSAELQIRIAATTDRGKGYGLEALRLLLRHGFRDRNLHRVQLHVFADNAPALGLYSRAGFREEGRLREAAFIDGKFKNIVVMGLLRAEFADA